MPRSLSSRLAALEAALSKRSTSSITWSSFRRQYADAAFPGMADVTASRIDAIFDSLEQVVKSLADGKLSSLTADKIAAFVKSRRSSGVAETTIKTELAHLRAALNWAVKQDMLDKVPSMPSIKRAKGQKLMKGRPITGEEFERMIEQAGGDADVRFFLKGLHTSGLRLGESLVLSWDADDAAELSVDFSGRRPMLRIPAEAEKGNQDRLIPMAPEFAALLETVPEHERTGKVFSVPGSLVDVSRLVSAIGKAANVVVNRSPLKYASAHDMRRSFGERWAVRVMPQVLMVLMRHESIETTLRYYVGRNAQTMAEAVWAGMPKVEERTVAELADAKVGCG